MPTLFALALRALVTASLLLAGTGSHAHGPGLAAASEMPAATQSPCHDGMDAPAGGDEAAAVSPSMGDGHCGDDCHCPCIALPMLVPHGISLIEPIAETAGARPVVLPWRSTASLPSLRPPIA